jgi:hypothetical protein
MENIYATPEAELKEPETGDRPRSPKVIGSIAMLVSMVSLLMSIVMLIALLSGLSAVLSELKSTGLSGPFAYVSVGLGLFSSLWMMFIGFKLFRYRDIGRRHFKIYLIFQMVSFVLTTGYQYFQIPSYSDPVEVLLTGIISTIIIFGIMFWLLSILNKPRVRASLS